MACSESDKFREECGVFGIHGHPDAAHLTYIGLHALQHRGEESSGIAATNGPELHVEKATGLVSDSFNQWHLNRLSGTSAIGHVRCSIRGEASINEAQPMLVNCAYGKIAVCHNGNLLLGEKARVELERRGAIFSSSSDVEIVLHRIARSRGPSFREAIPEVLRDIQGAFSMLFLTTSELIAIRDSRGFRPLALGRLDDAWVFASETCSFDLINAQWVRDVEPGEMIVVDQEGLLSSHPLPKQKHSTCLFEHVSFARPDSFIFGRSVSQSRQRLGRRLAIEQPADADIVVPVPNSGTAAAIGYASESGLSFRPGLVRNDFVGRTLFEPTPAIRALGVRIKFNPVRDLIVGRRVVLVDDSIVSGTTLKRLVRMIREAGAKEIHVRITCPPIIGPCSYGVDIPDTAELIGAQLSVEEIRQFIEADSLGYLSLQGMVAACGLNENSVCVACWNGDDPLPLRLSEEMWEGNEFVTATPLHSAVSEATPFESCFLSYSTKDEEFAGRLYTRLRKENINVWFAPKYVQGGRKLYEQIENAIKGHDRLLVVLSEHSMQSEWVVTEIRKARKMEIEERKRKLFPIRLVDFDAIKRWECFDLDTGKDLAIEIREYFVPNFSNWREDNEFEASCQKLLQAVRAPDQGHDPNKKGLPSFLIRSTSAAFVGNVGIEFPWMPCSASRNTFGSRPVRGRTFAPCDVVVTRN